jgi:uncharacterized protein YbjT (DUF2867 family)
MKILVTAGTGKVGSEVIKELVKRNVSLRALVRKQEASTTSPEGVDVFLGDLLDPVSETTSIAFSRIWARCCCNGLQDDQF